MRRRPLLADVILGAAAGAAATWLMDRVTTVLYERESKAVQDREKRVRGEKTAYVIAAEKAAALFDRELDEDQSAAAGSAIHWSLGTSAGALYGVIRNVAPSFAVGSGLVFGLAFWLAMDEAALTLLGLTPPPQKFPWQTHARGLAGHIVLGATIELPFDLLQATAGSPTGTSTRRNGG